MKTYLKLASVMLLFTLSSCKKFLEINRPVDQIVTEKVYSSDETANAAMAGIYARMMSGNGFASGGNSSVTLLAGRSSDEFINYYSLTDYAKQFSDNDLLPDNFSLRSGLWQEPYQLIYAANRLLENLERSEHVSNAMKKQLGGEAKFIRAFCNFYLTNLFGDVPLILTTDYQVNAIAFASTQEQIYAQIIKDLLAAKEQLSPGHPADERTRANKGAATALLARVYLYLGDWANAETQSSELINQTQKYQLADLDEVFLKNSKEAILQFFVPASSYVNTNEGSLFILTTAPGPSTEVVLSDDLVAAFEPGDQRRLKWVGTYTGETASWYYPYKYKVQFGPVPLNEYSMVLRLAEQYLIRAEARINQDKIAEGIADINVLRSRSRTFPTETLPDPLPAVSATLNQADALMAVEKERRTELFSEWGHRWLDLKRTNRANTILGALKPGHWQSTDALYPIPATELLNDKNLKQNKGYQEQ